MGTTRFAGSPDNAHLKVTFSWPFSGAYKVIALDQAGYQYALVTSSTYDYLWILARSPQLEESVYTKLVNIAQELGFETSRLIVVEHSTESKP